MLRSVTALTLLLIVPAVAGGQQTRPATFRSLLLESAEMLESADLATPPASRVFQLEDFEALAFEHNPTLAAASAGIAAARGRQVQAGLYPNPTIGYHATEVGNLGTAGAQGGFIAQRIITAGKRKLDRAIAGKEVDQACSRLHAQQQRVLSDVRVRFYQVYVAQRRVELAAQLSEIAEQVVTATQTLLQQRQGTENDRLQAEIRADQAAILLDNSRNEHWESWRRLVAVVGLPTIELATVQADLQAVLPEYDWDSCAAAVLAANPRLREAESRVQQSRLVIERARREPIPNIDVFLSPRHQNVTGDNVANIRVGIPIPIFNKNQGNIRAAESEWIASCREVKRIELALREQLAVAFRSYSNAHQQVQRYQQRILPRASRSLQLVSGGYESGQVEYLTLLTAQQTFLEVNLAHLDALRELHMAASLIASQLLSDSLADRR